MPGMMGLLLNNLAFQGAQGGAGVKMVTLPQYLLQDAGTPISFEDVSDWDVISGSAANNTTEFRAGTQSIKVTSGVGSNGVISLSQNMNFGGKAPHLRLSFYQHDTNLYGILLYLFKDDGESGYQNVPLTAVGRNGWYTVDFLPHRWQDPPSWEGTFNRFALYVVPKAGTQTAVSFDDGRLGLVSTPCVLINSDDGYLSNYDVIHNYLAQFGGRATFYTITNLIGSAGMCTAAQLQEMDAYGHAIANHTHNHVDLRSLSQEQAETELDTARVTLDALGLTKASRHVSYPAAGYNGTTVHDAMTATGMRTGRRTDTNAASPWSCNVVYGDNDYQMTGNLYILSTTTLDAAKAWIDQAISSQIPVMITLHRLVNGTPGAPIDWPRANFEALVDYIVAQKVPMISVADWWSAKSGPVTVPFAG